MIIKKGWRACLLIILMVIADIAIARERELRTIEFDSPAVGRTMKYNLLLPEGYEASNERYPVLYLLHGVNGNYTVWGTSNAAPFYAGLYDDLIVVMPDAGNSWYVNWTESQEGQKNNWEDYIVDDVVNHVDANFRTIPRREGRTICGPRIFSLTDFGSFLGSFFVGVANLLGC